MKFFVILFIFLTSSLQSFSQNNETIEDFFNGIKIPLVDSSFTKFYLRENVRRVYLDNLREIYFSCKKKIDTTTINEFIIKSEKDTLPLKWNCNKINKSYCVNDSTATKISIFNYFVSTKRKWSKRKVERQIKKQTISQQKERNKIPEEEKRVYTFSRPIFNKDKTLALFTISYNCGNLCGYKCSYFFKKIGSIWVELISFNCLIS